MPYLGSTSLILCWVDGRVRGHDRLKDGFGSVITVLSGVMRLIQPRWFLGYFRGFRTSPGRSATWEILHHGLFPINRFTPWWKLLSCVQLFETPWTIAGQAPLSMGFSRQEYWGGLSFPSPGDLPDLEIESVSPALQADSLPSEPPGKPDDQQMQKKVLTKFGTHLRLKKKKLSRKWM